ncbi:isopentenyl-diphosphate Delta-isomerase [Lachnotalea glycerini]|uniref:Isopentenyl-diphosphate delta-isomerase n=1 Tax=Lachnotalea glycerini TaxID=1763509 RepID=A0A371JCA6_9FIRM|nr:isopentenyl-diphosphate Delta-isomerase [Lachnotalea glycerini]RDY30372.1 isopentenyl-diphosphate Delta-isomerase [Lachnotalea glycerini]
MENEIILVDIFDQVVGHGEKLEVHKKGQLHRAFSVFLYHDNKLLIQKRAINKYHSGGLWANTCCSHPRVKESLEEAAKRRLFEEAGIDCDIEEIFSFIYRAEFENGLTEYELDHVFIGKYQGETKMNEDEMSELLWIDVDLLALGIMQFPQEFAPWFITASPQVIKYVKGLNK